MTPPLATLRLDSRLRTVTADSLCDHLPSHNRVIFCPPGMFHATVHPLSALPVFVTLTLAEKVFAA